VQDWILFVKYFWTFSNLFISDEELVDQTLYWMHVGGKELEHGFSVA